MLRESIKQDSRLETKQTTLQQKIDSLENKHRGKPVTETPDPEIFNEKILV